MKIDFQAETNFILQGDALGISQDPDGSFDIETVWFTRVGAMQLHEILGGYLRDESWGQAAPTPSPSQGTPLPESAVSSER